MDDYTIMTIREYQTALSSSSPTPGGGTAAAMSLGHSAALTCMVADLTLSKERWQDGWESAEQAQDVAIPLFQLALELANDDSKAFEEVLSAYRLPKDDDEEREARNQAIKAASIRAAEIPLQTALEAAGLLQVLTGLAEFGNANAVSDVGVAALLAHAACRGALFNVDINLKGLDSVSEMLESASCISETLENDLISVLDAVETRIG